MNCAYFDRLCYEAAALGHETGGAINTYREKRLHSLLKRYYAPDETTHEQRVGRFIADICADGEIIEVQTGGLSPLREKIAFYLEETDYCVTVVHPIPAVRWVCWLDPESGSISPRHRSPKKGSVRTALPELSPLAGYLANSRFRVVFPLLEVEDYRLLDGWSKDRKRGSTRYERIPLALLDEVSLAAPADYAALLPEALPDRFGGPEMAAAMRLPSIEAYRALKVWLAVGGIIPDGKDGRKQMYVRAEMKEEG